MKQNPYRAPSANTERYSIRKRPNHPWPLNMAGQLAAGFSRLVGLATLYWIFFIEDSKGQTFWQQAVNGWNDLNFISIPILLMPFITAFLGLVALPRALTRFPHFQRSGDDPPRPGSRLWKWGF